MSDGACNTTGAKVNNQLDYDFGRDLFWQVFFFCRFFPHFYCFHNLHYNPATVIKHRKNKNEIFSHFFLRLLYKPFVVHRARDNPHCPEQLQLYAKFIRKSLKTYRFIELFVY